MEAPPPRRNSDVARPRESITGSSHELPAETASFIGRERELAEVGRILAEARLLTLTGAGGCGKTRLALRAAAGLSSRFTDGVRLVEFAPVTDSALVPRAVAVALGVRGRPGPPLLTALATAMTSRRLLLVLDNCEHLIGACARVAETLLRACPQLRILATSREPLRIPGEVTWRVPPLALPPPDAAPTPESLAEVDAVELFVERARARRSDFALTASNAAAVARICRWLEGLPLGIELAAAQMAALSAEQVADRLDSSLRLLGGGSRTLGRQETLRATLDWSHDLLSDGEKVLLRRLAVFAGGFDAEAAEAVCAGDGIAPSDVLPLLTRLVEKSLVEPQAREGVVRHRLLEPVRQYSWARLAAEGDPHELQRRHAAHYVRLAESAEPRLMSGSRGPWMEQLAADEDNLRAVLAWSRQASEGSDRELGLRLAGALLFFWNLRGEVSEGLDWLEALLARSEGAAPAARALALYGAAELAWLAGQAPLAVERAEQSEALFRSLGDRRRLAYVLQSLPMAIDNPRAPEAVAESLRLFEEVGDRWGAALATAAVDLFALVREGDPSGSGRARLQAGAAQMRELGDDWGAAQMLNALGDLARSRGDDAEAAACYEESLQLLQAGRGGTGSVPSLLHNLGYLALRRNDTRRALRLFRESLTLFRDQGDRPGIVDCLLGLGGVLAAMRQPEVAARLLGSAEAQREAIGAHVWPANEKEYDRSLALLRAQLDQPALAAAWTAGRRLPLEGVIAEALAEQPVGGLAAGGDRLGLTRREREVASLVARGLSNRQIGAALFITQGTARLHVKHILQKSGFSSRAQVAAWAVEQGLTASAGPHL